MKKILAAILMVLCLLLAACAPSGDNPSLPDSRYHQLLAYLQAGLFEEARAELDRLALEAGETLPVTPTLPDYWFVIGTLPSPTEPAETEPAPTVPTQPAPTEPAPTDPPATEPEWETVEINKYNFRQYFTSVTDLYADINGFGETEMVHGQSYFVPRDGLELKTEECQLAIEVEVIYEVFPFTVDPDTGEVTLGESTSFHINDPLVVDFRVGYVLDSFVFRGYYSGQMTTRPEETTISLPTGYTILRAKGTIVVRGSVPEIPEGLG